MLLPVAVVCLGWLLIAGFDVVHLSCEHLLHVATLTIKLSNSVVDLGFDLVAAGDSRILDCVELVLGWTNYLQYIQQAAIKLSIQHKC